MNKSIASIAGGALLAATLAANAADMAAPQFGTLISPVPFSWAGFYLGANAGGVSVRDEYAAVPNVDLFPPFLQSQIPRVVVPARNATLPGFSANDSGFIGGGQVGFNWQVDHIVFGVEGDVAGTRLETNGTATVADPIGAGSSFTANYSATTEWIATARVRAGLAWDRFLVYATGGLAVGGTHIVTTLTRVDPTPSVINLGPPFGTTDSSGGQVGWTAGIGAEWALTQALSVGAEYRHIDLGGHIYHIGRTLPEPDGVPVSTNIKTTLDQATLRVNWRWGMP